jgi:uncharacterized protein YjbI with pentapeptide repeats
MNYGLVNSWASADGVGCFNIGELVTTYGRSREDVIRWPCDPNALRALEDYFGKLSGDSQAQLDAEGLDFTGADLSGLELLGAELSQANLSGVRLAGADLYVAWIIAAVLHDADLSQCDLRKVKGRMCDAQRAVFSGADLQRSEFENTDFREANLSKVRFGRATLLNGDLRGADLRECIFGHSPMATHLKGARLAGSRVEGAVGMVSGPINVGTDSPRLVDGADLQRWFADHGAPLVEVREPARP